MSFSGLGLVFGILGRTGGKPHGGPFILQTDGSSKIRQVNNVDRILILGIDPTSGNTGQSVGLLLALTYP
jgi:hypothetical protein